MGFLFLVIIIIAIIVIVSKGKKSSETKLPEYFNCNSLLAHHQLVFEASIDDIERWLKNGSLGQAYFLDENKIDGDLTIFSWITDSSEEGMEKLDLLKKYGYDINITNSSGKNAAMSYIARIEPVEWFKAEEEKTIPESQYHNTGYLSSQLQYFKNIGLDFSLLDNKECSVFYYAIKNIINEDIKTYPDLLIVCNTLREVFSIKPKINDILRNIGSKNLNSNTAKKIISSFYNKDDIEILAEFIDSIKSKIDEQKYRELKSLL